MPPLLSWMVPSARSTLLLGHIVCLSSSGRWRGGSDGLSLDGLSKPFNLQP